MKKERKNIAEEMRDKAMEYLNESYDDIFTPKSYTSESWAYKYATVIFSSEKFSNSSVEVRMYKNEDGSYQFMDDYYKCYMHKEVKEYYEGFFTNSNEVTILFRFPNTIWSNKLNNADSFAMWRQNGNCNMDVFFITRGELPEDERVDIVAQIAEDKIAGTVTFFTTKAENLLKDKALSDVLNNQGTLVDDKVKYRINSKFEIKK